MAAVINQGQGQAAIPVTAKVGELDGQHAHGLRVKAPEADGTTRWESPSIALAALPVSSPRQTLWLVGLSLALAAFLFPRWRKRKFVPNDK